MHIVKQSTAFTDTVGPILDSTGVEYTGAVIGDISINKNGTESAMASAATLTHVSNGYYTLVFTTGNTDTLGRIVIRCNKSTYQMPPVRYEVLAAAVFDTLVTNGTLASNTSGRTQVVDASGIGDANIQKILGTTSQGAAGYAAIDAAQAISSTQTTGTVGEALLMMINRVGRRGTAQAGTSSTITLDSGASAVDNIYTSHSIKIIAGTGIGQIANITAYVGSTKVATILRPGPGTWTTNPDNTSVFQIEAVPLAAVGFFLFTVLTETTGQITAAFKKFFNIPTPAATMDHGVLVDTATTATNLTNAPTAGDLTAAMKTSVQTATDAAITANTLVLEIEADTDTLTAGVTVTTNNDKTGYGLSAAAVQAIWDALTSALTTAGSIGKRIMDFVTTLVYAAAPTAVQNRQEMDSNSTKLANLDVASSTLGTATNLAEANADLDEIITTLGTLGSPPTVVQIRQEIDSNSTALAEINADTDEMIVTLGTPANVSVSADIAAVAAFPNRTVIRGTVGSGSTTTSVVTSALTPAGVHLDGFKGAIIIFDNLTTTAALRGQRTDITGSTASGLPVLTVTLLTDAPVSGDTFSIC